MGTWGGVGSGGGVEWGRWGVEGWGGGGEGERGGGRGEKVEEGVNLMFQALLFGVF